MPAALRHSGRVALVTGGATGIGRAYARRLAQGGAEVVVADLAEATETVELIRSEGGRASAAVCDVSDEQGVIALRDGLERPVDILVHNAGIYPMHPFAEVTAADWRRVLSVNLDSLFYLASTFVPGMRERGWGRVIAISSGMVHLGAANAAPYVTSKAGVIGFIRALSSEVGVDGVTVNAIAPGLIRSTGTSTGLHDSLGIFDMVVEHQSIKRTGTPEDLVGFVDLLSSDDGGFMTGQTLLVDGGVAHS